MSLPTTMRVEWFYYEGEGGRIHLRVDDGVTVWYKSSATDYWSSREVGRYTLHHRLRPLTALQCLLLDLGRQFKLLGSPLNEYVRSR